MRLANREVASLLLKEYDETNPLGSNIEVISGNFLKDVKTCFNELGWSFVQQRPFDLLFTLIVAEAS
jgi:hypothetical protein